MCRLYLRCLSARSYRGSVATDKTAEPVPAQYFKVTLVNILYMLGCLVRVSDCTKVRKRRRMCALIYASSKTCAARMQLNCTSERTRQWFVLGGGGG